MELYKVSDEVAASVLKQADDFRMAPGAMPEGYKFKIAVVNQTATAKSPTQGESLSKFKVQLLGESTKVEMSIYRFASLRAFFEGDEKWTEREKRYGGVILRNNHSYRAAGIQYVVSLLTPKFDENAAFKLHEVEFTVAAQIEQINRYSATGVEPLYNNAVYEGFEAFSTATAALTEMWDSDPVKAYGIYKEALIKLHSSAVKKIQDLDARKSLIPVLSVKLPK